MLKLDTALKRDRGQCTSTHTKRIRGADSCIAMLIRLLEYKQSPKATLFPFRTEGFPGSGVNVNALAGYVYWRSSTFPRCCRG